MKKLLALILTLSMVFSLAVCTAVYADVEPSLAYDLNIVSPDTPDAITTRGEFASMIAKVMQMNPALRVNNSVYTFYDVPEEHPHYAEIEFLAKAGIIIGNGDGYFYPNRAISVSEASKMMIHALSYDLMVTDGNYQAAAISRKLFDGVEFTDGGFTHENAAIIISNMLEAPYDEFEGINGNLTFSGESYMERCLGIYEHIGVVTDDGLTSLTADTGVEEGFIKVDNTVYYYSGSTAGLIGRKVVVYYRKSQITSKWYDAVSIKTIASDDTITLDSADINGFDNYTYRVEDANGKRKDYKISKTANIRYNGRILKFDKSVTQNEFDELMCVKTGQVTLVDTDGGAYDFVDVLSYKSMVVGSVFEVDKDEFVIYSQTNKGDFISLNYEDTDYVITDTRGNGIYLDMIKKDDVISYALSLNGEWARIIVSNNVFSKGIDEISEESIVIDGTEYKFAPEYSSNASIGTVGKVYLNFRGEIVYISQGSGNGVLALFGGYNETAGLLGKLKVQVFTEQGNLVELTIDKNVTIDGQKKTPSQAKEFFEKKNLMFNVVNIVYDSEKVLKKLDTPYSDCDSIIGYDPQYESRDTMHYVKNAKDQAGTAFPFNYYNTSFGGEIIVDGNTVVFAYPSDATNLEDVFLASVTEKYFADQLNHYTFSAYSRKENSVYAEAITLKGMDRKYDLSQSNYTSNPSLGIVTKITNTSNSAGELAQKIYIETGSKIVEYVTEDMDTLKCSKWNSKLCDIEVGDIVKFIVPSDNILYTKAIMPLYDMSADKIVSYGELKNDTWSARGYMRISEAYCVNIIDGIVEYAVTPPDDVIDYNNTKTYAFRMADTPLLVFDKSRHEVSGGSINDMIASVVDAQNATKFYYLSDIGKPVAIVVYK